ncbi:type II secretion system protein GspJ [Luteimonas aestuarii]|uniref:Type II secretion system protein GspJ n=2 Tax=Luteimonas aestuarii TaxID=453837 RepID=A0A4R5U4V3_9GAMM|nr:type II secretion system protein GspJ [Luteimonas aestuarii]
MLVAMAVFALLSGAAVLALAHAADQQAAVRTHLDRMSQLQLAHGLLQADLSQAVARRTRRPDGGADRHAFNAAPRDPRLPLLAFVRHGWDNPDDAPRASLQYVEYRIADGRLERSARSDLDGARPGTPQVLLEGVRAGSLAFHVQGRWNDGWIGGQEALPDAVALELELEHYGRVRQVFLLPGAST